MATEFRRGLGVFAAVVVLGLVCLPGCQSRFTVFPQGVFRSRSTAPANLPRSTIAATTIVPGMVLCWNVEPLPGEPPQPMRQAVVSADGMMDLEEYGTVRVGGLTIAEAQAAIEERLYQTQQARSAFPAHDVRTVSDHSTSKTSASGRDEVAVASSQSAEWGPPRAPLALDRNLVARATPLRAKPVEGVLHRVQYAEPMPSGGEPTGASDPDKPPTLHAPTLMREGGVVTAAAPVFEGCLEGPHGAAPPRELRMTSLPPYVIDPPDILLVQSTQGLRDQPIQGQHLVRPDGTIGLGIYGSVHVAGLTLEQARMAIAAQVSTRVKDFDVRNLYVDVLAYNSKVYYVVTDGAGFGEQVTRVPITGYETVLDAISQINGLPPVASKKHIWIARRGENGQEHVLPVDWNSIVRRGSTITNYQIMPGDRLYVKADPVRTFDTHLAKFLSPVERLFGVTLLAGTTVNTLKGQPLGPGFGGR